MDSLINALWQDLRYAGRTLVRAPGFALLAILTIAVGVGANAAIFSVVNAVLLRPLPYPRANELLIVSQANRITGQSARDATPANFLDWRERNHTFTGMSGYADTSFSLASADQPVRVAAAVVNANFFDVLQVRPALGRSFAPSDERHGAPRVAIISDGLWRERFGGGGNAIGQTLRLNDEPHTIVAVMPAGIDYPDKVRLWVPPHWRVPDDPQLSPADDPSTERGHGYFVVLARLKPGVAFETARADMDAVAARLEREYPDDNENVGVSLVGLRDNLVADVRSTTLLLFGAVLLLLLIATANVSGLLIARATARQQEIALRAALGASRGRILGQLLTESVLLALLGGGAGVLLAMWMINPLVALSPADLAVAGDVTMDQRVLIFALATSTFAGLLFGLAPARQLSRLDLYDDLKQSTRGGVGVRQRRARAWLVSAEIALSLVLLVAAGLVVRSFVRLQHVSPGFDPEHVLTVTVAPSTTHYGTQAKRADFWERTLQSFRAIPGVEVTGATSRLPLRPGNSTRGIEVKNLPPGTPTGVDYRTASPDYFSVMRIPVLRGRAFEDGDREGRRRVAVVSGAAALRFWPGRDPIGETFQIDVPGPEYTVVGLVGDVRSASLETAPRATIYVPYRQDAFPFMTFVVRTNAAPSAIAPALRAAVWSVDKDQAVNAVLTMNEQLSHSLTRRRFSVTLLTIFGATAVLLAAVGLYGVLTFIVSQRTREIGVRMALGATARDVVTDVLGQGLRLAGFGMVAGVALALVATRLTSALLFGTSPTDVATFAGAAVLLAAIAVIASLVPALRASRVDPLVALRDE